MALAKKSATQCLPTSAGGTKTTECRMQNTPPRMSGFGLFKPFRMALPLFRLPKSIKFIGRHSTVGWSATITKEATTVSVANRGVAVPANFKNFPWSNGERSSYGLPLITVLKLTSGLPDASIKSSESNTAKRCRSGPSCDGFKRRA